MKLLTLLVLGLVPLSVIGQTQEIPQAARDELAKDISGFQALIAAAQQKQQAALAARSLFGALGAASVAITSPVATVHAGADDKAAMIFKAKKDQTFPIIDRAGDWYAIGFKDKIKGQVTGWVPAKDVVPRPSQPVQHASIAGDVATAIRDAVYGEAEELFRKATEEAIRLRDKYRKNEYFAVSGFSITIGVPPSASLDFTFK